mgnify:CR=1 FL=1
MAAGEADYTEADVIDVEGEDADDAAYILRNAGLLWWVDLPAQKELIVVLRYIPEGHVHARIEGDRAVLTLTPPEFHQHDIYQLIGSPLDFLIS